MAESRDPKGLYAKARKGDIKDFTGISAPYEEPESPEVLLWSGVMSVEESVKHIMEHLQHKGLLEKSGK